MPFQISNVTKSYGEALVLRGLSLILPERGLFLISGPSGSGKTTLLRILAGLEQPDSGSRLGFTGKRVSMVFQELRLLPHSSALENVALVCDAERAAAWLAVMALRDVGAKKPRALSGGQKQRVALARALAFGGDLLLLDEPFNGLDKALRERILPHVLSFAEHAPVVLVSHEDISGLSAVGELVLTNQTGEQV